MDFAKFVALLESRSLYFSRADNLGDLFEGAAGFADRRAEWDAFYLEYFRESVRTAPGRTEPLATEYVEREAARLLKEISLVGERERRTTFVSCWHANGVESEALWRLYCPPPVIGVAVQTTAALLTDALGDPKIKIGRVQYVDFRKAFAGFHDRIFWKRKSLSHEMEVRAAIAHHDGKEAVGVLRVVDIEKMVTSVVASPFAPSWFIPLVKSTMERFGVSLPVIHSELLAEPFF
ncbi:MAG: hypothetical protein LCH56_14815 [Proteobacteria bacterium]|nr:hypothetical protein [Pseudomonadota bacterium]